MSVRPIGQPDASLGIVDRRAMTAAKTGSAEAARAAKVRMAEPKEVG